MKWTKKAIIERIEENGGLDMCYIRCSARHEGISIRQYVVEYVKSSFACHGNTANAVADYFC